MIYLFLYRRYFIIIFLYTLYIKTADRLAVPFTVLSLMIAGIAWAMSGVPTRTAL